MFEVELYGTRVACSNTVKVAKKETIKIGELILDKNTNGGFTVKGNCLETKKPYEIVLNKKESQGFIKWKRGLAIEKAMPTVSADNRETLKSGVSPKGWKQRFKKSEHYC